MLQIGRVAQWITRLPTEQKIAGSSPAVVAKSFVFHMYTVLLYVEIKYNFVEI